MGQYLITHATETSALDLPITSHSCMTMQHIQTR